MKGLRRGLALCAGLAVLQWALAQWLAPESLMRLFSGFSFCG